MNDFKINAAIQLLPIDTEKKRWDVVDKAIAIIQESGLNYKVCPFETVIEGDPTQVYAVIENIRKESLNHAQEILINIKIHAANRDLRFSEKLEKY